MNKNACNQTDSFIASEMDSNPLASNSNSLMQCDHASKSNEEFEKTLRAFEMSQLNQKQRKPRTSNFIGDFDFYTQHGENVLLCGSGNNGQMGTIQEDDQSSNTEGDECKNSNSVTYSSHVNESTIDKIDLSDSKSR